MPHFLFRPHVVRADESVSSPDPLLDRVTLADGSERVHIPIQRLSSATALQVPDGDVDVTPAAALIACGGGALLGMAMLIREAGASLPSADVVLTRRCWRLRNVADKWTDLKISLSGGDQSALRPLRDLATLDSLTVRSPEGEAAVPRGVVVLNSSLSDSLTLRAPAAVTLTLSRAAANQSLAYSCDLLPVDVDPWTDRPLPRYAVGPVEEVEHYL